MSDPLENRRPLASRQTGWARRGATLLADLGISPNAVSASSVVFAALGALLLLLSAALPLPPRGGALIGAAVCIQLRLLANLLDGMVAVEHGRSSPTGPIWNEAPDRIADILLLVSAGYAVQRQGLWFGADLGWVAGVLAVLTAYVRELGRGLGLPADFRGPMAKPHRMAMLTVCSLLAAAEPLWGWSGETLAIGLGLIAVGATLTVIRRTAGIAAGLRGR